MNKSEISEKELTEIKKTANEILKKFPAVYSNNNIPVFLATPIDNDKLALALSCVKLITALEHKNKELDAVKKENEKLKDLMKAIATKLCENENFRRAAKDYFLLHFPTT
jgi:chemotaxis response regulator CheB